MRSNYSDAWKSSTQPRKQRKRLFNLPEHKLGEALSVHLSKSLREKHKTRAVRVRTGDKVKVLRGTHKGKEGRVDSVDTKRRKVVVAKVERTKLDGGKAPYPLSPSNLMITELAADKRRLKDRSAQKAAKTAKTATPATPATKPTEKKAEARPAAKAKPAPKAKNN